MRKSDNHISLLKVLSVTTLLVIYVLVSLFNNLHQYFHHNHHQLEICSAETEKDPCHIKVFHHNQTDGCKHETHVYTMENQCELCDAILAKYYFPDEKIVTHVEDEIFDHFVLFEEPFVLKYSNASIWLRGPPRLLFFLV